MISEVKSFLQTVRWGRVGVFALIFIGVASMTLTLAMRVTPNSGVVETRYSGGQDSSSSLLARRSPLALMSTAGSPGQLLPTPPQDGGPFSPQSTNGAITWVDAATGSSTTVTRLTAPDFFTQFYWPLDQDAGSTLQGNFGQTGLLDSGLYAMNGLGSPCPVFQTGLFNAAVTCFISGNCTGGSAGTGGSTVNVPLDAGALGSNVTWSLWYYPLSFSTNFNAIFQRAYRTSSAAWAAPFDSLVIEQESNAGCWACGIAIHGVSYAVGTINCGIASTDKGFLVLNQWQNLACTYDGTTLVAYYNGNAFNTTTPTGGGPIDFGDGGTNQTGGYFDIMYAQQSNNQCTIGSIDDVRVENTTRSASYMRQLFQDGLYSSQN